MTVFGLDAAVVVVLFGWIPFWWAVAAISLYRMRRNDERSGRTGEW